MSALAGVRGAIMVQGTTSDAGKSTVACALCRLLRRAGVSVAPFKPQNMALNSAVTADGGEIGRAQALQAFAAGIEPHTDMNPVLLKPESDMRAQLIVNGRARATLDAAGYHAHKPRLLSVVLAAYRRLREEYDVVVVEGAGSPAEINLREGDIANMGFAVPTGTPVILVADIERGGVFAHLVGTLDCLSPRERALVSGFVINRFRGDRGLLAPGTTWLEQRTSRPVLGCLPYLQGLHLDAEDALIRSPASTAWAHDRLRVAVPVFPRISNHTDIDALRAHPRVEVVFVEAGQAIPAVDLVILCGSKSVQSDLRFLREQGWERQIARHLRYGGKVIGICGGMQMLGRELHDPTGIEGASSSIPGLGLLDLQTTLLPEKQLRRVRGRLAFGEGAAVEGYEIHHGVSAGAALRRPAVLLDGRPDGAMSDDANVLGSYVHGLFDSPAACASLLSWAGLEHGAPPDLRQLREASLDRLADEAARHLDLGAVAAAIRSFGRGEARKVHA